MDSVSESEFAPSARHPYRALAVGLTVAVAAACPLLTMSFMVRLIFGPDTFTIGAVGFAVNVLALAALLRLAQVARPGGVLRDVLLTIAASILSMPSVLAAALYVVDGLTGLGGSGGGEGGADAGAALFVMLLLASPAAIVVAPALSVAVWLVSSRVAAAKQRERSAEIEKQRRIIARTRGHACR